MLVAEKKLVFEHDYQESIEVLAQKQQRPRTVNRPKQAVFTRVMPIFAVLLGFAMASILVGRYAFISANQQDILMLQNTLEQKYRIREQLDLELTFRESLDYIEEMASNNLEMSFPGQGQVQYVEIPPSQEKPVKAQTVQTEEYAEKNMWEIILGIFTRRNM